MQPSVNLKRRALEEETPTMQASSAGVSLEAICSILVRQALDELLDSPATAKKLWITLDYGTWTLSARHNGRCAQGRKMMMDIELALLSHLGTLYHCCTLTGSGLFCATEAGSVLVPSSKASKNASRDVSSKPRERGGVISLRNLFHKVPIRRSFLSAASNQQAQNDGLVACIRHLSLAAPGVEFHLRILPPARRSGAVEQAKPLTLPSVPDLVQRCQQIYGPAAVQRPLARVFGATYLLNASSTLSPTRDTIVRVAISGLVAATSTATATAPMHLFVNGRAWPLPPGPSPSTASSPSTVAVEEQALTEHLVQFGLGAGSNAPSDRAGACTLMASLYADILDRIAAMPWIITAPCLGEGRAFVIVITLTTCAKDGASPSLFCNASTFRRLVLDAVSSADRPMHSTEAGSLPPSTPVSTTPEPTKTKGRNCTAPESTAAYCYERSNVAHERETRLRTASLAVPEALQRPALPVPGTMIWRQPTTARTFYINQRTGQSFGSDLYQGTSGSNQPSQYSIVGPKSRMRSTLVDRSRLSKRLADVERCGTTSVPDWLTAAMKGASGGRVQTRTVAHSPAHADEDNEFDDAELDAVLAAYAYTLDPSPVDEAELPLDSPFSEPEEAAIRELGGQQRAGVTGQQAPGTATQASISRSDLRSAVVLGQIDNRLIACAIARPDQPRLLVCIDQHAADERCRLEQLLQDYLGACLRFDPPATALCPPATLNIAHEVYELLVQCHSPVRRDLAFLGFSVTAVVLVHGGSGHAQVDVGAIPQFVYDRVVSRAGRLQHTELLASTLASVAIQLAQHPLPPCAESERPLAWFEMHRHLPAVLRDLLASAACRSAIMFGDPLPATTATALVRALARCAFPFQCAHARPIIAPLCSA
nr:mismatch repair and meiotic recombination protein [Tranzscheliella williamsii]